MTWYQIYFSPTGGTKRVADIVSRSWKGYKVEIDLSDKEKDFSSFSFQEEDVCLVAVPAFGGRVPEIALKRIRDMIGGKAKAILLAVYGNRAYEDTLLESKETLLSAGFQCVAAMAAIAEHSIMHQFGAGRPDEQDEQELTAFAEKIAVYLEADEKKPEVQVPGNVPYREYKGVPLKPKAGKKCTACGLCASRCPVGAIPMEKPSSLEEEKCISCMRCLTICPQHARELNKMLLMAASQKIKKACSERKQNELFV